MNRQSQAAAARLRRPLISLLLLVPGVLAQSSANWNTTSGNWGKAANWDCVINNVSANCVPGAGFVVTNINGDITLDVSPTIAYLMGSGGSLTLNGKSLTATDPLGIQQVGGLVDMSGGSVINGSLITTTLHMQSSTVNGGTQAFDVNVNGSTLGSITVANQLIASNSSFGPNSNVTIASGSSIGSSTIGGQFLVNQGASLTVDAGSNITSTTAFVTSGSVTLQGGSTWNASTGPFALGLAPGGASLDVTGAGSVLNLSNTALELGEISSSTVTVEHGGSIAATGSQGSILIGLGVVFPNDSKMIVNSAGTVSATNITVAGNTGVGSTGVLQLSDSSSSVTANGQLIVTTGGAIDAANQSSLNAKSVIIQTGTVTIESNASFTVNSDTAALIGSMGSGNLILQSGGTATAPGEIVLGVQSATTGALTIAGGGSEFHGGSSISVGETGTGMLNITNAGLLETAADASGISGSLGTQTTGNGTATLQGGDWQASGKLQIGVSGTGTLNLLQAGTVESGEGTIGVNAASMGSASVSGAGSKWTDSGKLTVGSNGTGYLSISGGGVVTNVDAVIGDKRGSNGVVTVTGTGSSWQNSGLLTIGGDGGASLTVDAGTVTAGGGAMGSNFSPVQVTVTNHGALSFLGELTIGGAAATDVMIEKGSTLDSGENGTVGGSGGDTTVTVTGTDSAWTLHGTSNLVIDDKGSLLVMDDGTVTAGTITLDPGGLLNGQGGHLIGTIVNAGGTLTSGDATGTLTVTGNYTQGSGVLLFEIDGFGPAQFDRLLISGLADITGGSLEIQFGNGFAPSAGESFTLLSAALGLQFTNVIFDVPALPAGLHMVDTITPNDLEVSFVGAAGTPEPSAMALCAFGLAALLAHARKRTVNAPSPDDIRRGQNTNRVNDI